MNFKKILILLILGVSFTTQYSEIFSSEQLALPSDIWNDLIKETILQVDTAAQAIQILNKLSRSNKDLQNYITNNPKTIIDYLDKKTKDSFKSAELFFYGGNLMKEQQYQEYFAALSNAKEAALNSDWETVKTTIENMISVNSRIFRTDTILHMLVSNLNPNIDFLKFLLSQPFIDVNIKNEDGETPLIIASDRGPELNAELIQRQAQPVNIASLDQAITMLLKKPIQVNATDSKGNSALAIACSNGRINTVKALIDKGANVNLKDNRGRTPLDKAQDILKSHPKYSKIFEEIVSLLKSNGAKTGEELKNNS